MAQTYLHTDEVEEDVVPLSEEKKRADPLFRCSVAGGVVESIEIGQLSQERLYVVRYGNGDIEHMTWDQVEDIKVLKPADPRITPPSTSKLPLYRAMRGAKVKKAMKARSTLPSAAATTSVAAATASVAKKLGLNKKDVKRALMGIMEVAAKQLNSFGKFNLCGFLRMKLKKTPAKPARKGRNPVTKELLLFKPKPASSALKAYPGKRMKQLINSEKHDVVHAN
eukprot:TRINITY_DN9713_c0_g2_i1.p1 TRINITY_DN9713_c0_g2~~TRINITY_DN9713_c0_g2_i1.p1  ORF type:complete len:256 (-),score=47.78 TRINITY_DN9713_c0_g2_i1:20-691(-)